MKLRKRLRLTAQLIGIGLLLLLVIWFPDKDGRKILE